jgi:Zn-finger nucleic acid-binding protein
MRCPDCEVDLLLGDRAGVEINYCSKCRGVWLERGNLDKIIERSLPGGVAAQTVPQTPGFPPPYQQDPNYPNQQRQYREREDDDDDDEHGQRDNRVGPDGKKKRRGGFFGDFLDFG